VALVLTLDKTLIITTDRRKALGGCKCS
jgi:hypothetical protein